MITALRDLRDTLVSLKFTVILLVFGMLLVFAATIDQVNLGIWAVQQKYFRSFIVYSQVGSIAVPVFPGGYLIGGLLLLNLIAAHVDRFSLAWRKAGLLLVHTGLIILLVGELLSGLLQHDYHMRINEGETKNYAESFHANELAIIDTSNAGFDEVVAIPEELLASRSAIQHPRLPFRIGSKTYYPNSTLQVRLSGAPTDGAGRQATAGFGERVLVAPQPVTHRPNETNSPSAFIEISGPDATLGTYLVSTQIVMPQEFNFGGRTWTIALRAKRSYQPYSLTLLKFSHDRYAGTEIPKNFSSRLRLTTPDGTDDREVLIYMNNPLRYAGLTFYQAGFENDDHTTVLQVVRNPSWVVPYLACALMTLGLVMQFGLHLIGFVRRRQTSSEAQPTGAK